MSTFVGTANASHAGHSCYRCNATNGIVDMDTFIVGEGILALCSSCIRDAAEVAGIAFNDAEVRELRSELLRLSPERITELENEITLLTARLEIAEAVKQETQVLLAGLQGVVAKLQKPAAPRTKTAAATRNAVGGNDEAAL